MLILTSAPLVAQLLRFHSSIALGAFPAIRSDGLADKAGEELQSREETTAGTFDLETSRRLDCF